MTAHAAARGDVLLVDLDPTRGSESRKTRPCVVVSPDELNSHVCTLIVAPLIAASHPYPLRVSCRFKRRVGHIVLDQVRTIDEDRVVRHLGRISPTALERVLAVLQEQFAP